MHFPLHNRSLLYLIPGLYAGSALSVAAEIGLAPWIVELRHQATHDKLPSLVLLHSARAQGLDWLRQNYWEIQAHSTTLLQTSLQECISSYISAQIDGNPDNIVLEYLSTLKSALNVDMVHFLIPILLRTGFFNFDLVEECLTLPQETKSYWEPLLTCCICTYPTFTSLLLESLIEMLGQSTCTLEKTKKIEIWIMFLIERYLDPWKNYSVSRAIYQLLQVRCKTTLRISKWIAGKYDVPEITKSIFLYLEDKPYTNPVIDFDLDERYQHVSKRAKCNYDNENVSDAGIWKRAVGWYPSHLGTLNGSVADLKLDDEYDNHELMSSAGRIWNASKV